MPKKSKKKEGAKPSKKNKKDKKLQTVAPVSFAQSIGIADPYQGARLNSLFNSLTNLNTYKDVGEASMLAQEFQKELGEQFVQKDLIGTGWSYYGVPDIFGFRGFSSQFNAVFGNVFGVFAWISENYWPVLDCMNILNREILSDGYRLEGGTKEEQQKAKEVCTKLNMKRLRCQIAQHLKCYGNVFFQPVRNGLKGIKELKPLLPAYIRPIPTYDGQHIQSWQVQQGAYYRVFDRDELIYTQFRPSARNYDIGSPPLGAVLVDIEADVSASDFSCALMQKGGLYGIAVLLEGAQQGQARGKGPSAYAQYLHAALTSNHSGNRSAYETVVFENAKDVKVMNKLSELDSPFQRQGDMSAKKTAHALGIPHEMIGIITNANQQYHPSSLLDYSMKQLDKTIAEVLDITDTLINSKIFPMFGVKNVRLVASPRYNSVTAVAAKAGADLGNLVDTISINEFRVNYLGLHPVDGGDRALMKYQIQPPVTGGEGSAGSPASIFEPNPMPPMIKDEGTDLGNDEPN